MALQVSALFWDPKFLGTYVFGLIIIVMYAKDKFNMPTYDKAAMGPFAQLPPQSLTMDRSYRQGRTTYMFMLLCLYTAVCVVGPATFPDLFKFMKDLPSQYQLGVQASNPELWPIAAATFLVSTGAMSDGSMLGKVEFLLRQYAHKTAYIPRTVRDLGRSLRETDVLKWLGQEDDTRLSPQVIQNRTARLKELAGRAVVEEFIKSKEHSSEELTRWLRANVLFATLDGLFRRSIETVEGRLDDLTDLPANKEVFTSITGSRKELYDTLVDANGAFQTGKGDAARLSKDVSLMLAVLLSQGARNQAELDDYLKRMGLEEAHFHPSDASTFVTTVNVWLCLGVLATGIAVAIGYAVPFLRPLFDLTGTADSLSKDLLDLAKSIDIFPWLAIMINGVLSYLIAFRVLIYCRDTAMESREWVENLASRIRVVSIASGVSCAISFVAIVLLFAVVGKLQYVAYTPFALVHTLVLQFLLSLLLSCFALYYLRRAPLLSFARPATGFATFWTQLAACVKQPSPWIHAASAALLVAVLSSLAAVNLRGTVVDQIQQQYDQSLSGLLTNQNWIKERLAVQAAPIASVSGDARKKSEDEANAAVVSVYNTLRTIPLGPIWDIDRMRSRADFQPRCTTTADSTLTNESLCHLASICQRLNHIRLSAPPPPSSSMQPPDCTNQAPPANTGGIGSQLPAGNPQAKGSNPRAALTAPLPNPPTPRPGATAEPQVGAQSDPQPPTVTPEVRDQDAPVPYSLFKDAATCVPYDRATLSCSEGSFLGLGKSFSGLYQSLQNFDNFHRSNQYHATIVTPALTAFFVALTFGVGCLFCRANWLREGLGTPQGRKLMAELKMTQQFDDKGIDDFMVKPLESIGKLTPLEALRYEEFSIKLLDVAKIPKAPGDGRKTESDALLDDAKTG